MRDVSLVQVNILAEIEGKMPSVIDLATTSALKVNESWYIALFGQWIYQKIFSQLVVSIFTFLNQ